MNKIRITTWLLVVSFGLAVLLGYLDYETTSFVNLFLKVDNLMFLGLLTLVFRE